MFLKKIELQGFKSFADKTKIEFESGITGVVGPNGSGKSNISDAIRWVLGEQSVKSLRGSKMEDVVFAGTTNRKPQGFAEVTLVLDNTEKDLPIEYSEVSVTRRVFRSGESEYYINKNSCRLKDIKELFMDTGVGKDGYSIIGQGRIDEILSSKSEDRRNIFEEAAGIVKYKSRKEEAEKKLEKTEENLVRINDIVNELEKQITPLETQSKKAKEYKELTKELKNLQINLYVEEIMKIKNELKQIEEQKALSNQQLEIKQEQKLQLDNKYNLTKREIDKMNLSIEKINNNKFDIKSQIEKKKNEINLIKEKISFLEKEIERNKREILETKEHIKESTKQASKSNELEEDLKERLEKLSSEIEEKDKAFQKLKKEIEEKEKDIEDKKSLVIEMLNSIADKKNKINSLNSFKENVSNRLKQISDESSDLSKLTEEEKANISDLEKRLTDYNNKLIETNEYLGKVINNKNSKTMKLTEINKELNNITGNLQRNTSRHKLLLDMSREYEGYYKGVKNALMACDRNEKLGRGVKGVLAELITTPKKYEKAVEVALGSSIQNIVIDTQENAKVIINHLKSNNLGRVTFLPMSSISRRYLNPNEQRFLNENGVLGIGSELLDYDEECRNIIEYLLGRVLFVEKIEDGIDVSKKSNYSLKIVSLDGDVLNPGGSMTGGSLNNYNTKLLGRQREIDELKKGIDLLNLRYKSILKEKQILEEDINNLEKELLGKSEVVNDLKLNIATTKSKYEQTLEEDNKNKELIDRFKIEQINLTDENINVDREVKEIELELDDLNTKNKDVKKNIEKYIKEIEEVKYKKEVMDKELIDLKVSKASIKQEYKNICETIVRIEGEIEKSINTIETKQIEKDKVAKDIDLFKEKIKLNIDEKNAYKDSLSDYELKLQEINSDKNNYIQTFNSEELKLNQINKEIEEAQKGINLLELSMEKLNIQYENYNNKLWEEYELSFVMALEYKKDISDLSKVQSEVKNIKEKIKVLGHINLSSIEEYETVKERYEFMTSQIKDLSYAKDSLDSVISEMQLKMKEQFSESFKIIKENFILVFKELFGGGKADVFLTDEKEVLSSGIEIVAQPPGKKLQSLSLLSGGERALTAIALLFAIIKTKPTPFCILDEIEAALDEANVYRYAKYLKEFSNTTQFIAITHRKGTMENVDSLYGVTMEEQGISKLVSIKLSENEKVS